MSRVGRHNAYSGRASTALAQTEMLLAVGWIGFFFMRRYPESQAARPSIPLICRASFLPSNLSRACLIRDLKRQHRTIKPIVPVLSP